MKESGDHRKILVTGAAGFIGFHLAQSLVRRGDKVVGLDNISGYYDISLKLARLNQLGIKENQVSENQLIQSHDFENLQFIKADLKDKNTLDKLFESNHFDIVVNLAAQAGVRYSVENPQVYIDANIQGFINILEACRKYPVKHLVYASSSSVYGNNTKMPFSVHDNVDHPVSLYAATKKSNELMAHAYSHLYGIPTTGLRFFTVYGPWGRPDMALFLFADAIANNRPIKVFNNGDMARDFTYIDDIIKGVMSVINNPAKPNKEYSGNQPDPGSSNVPYKLYNIGKNQPVKLIDFIEALEVEFGQKAKKEFLPLQQGDVPNTFADVEDLIKDFNFKPETNIETGIHEFVKWYKSYYNALDNVILED